MKNKSIRFFTIIITLFFSFLILGRVLVFANEVKNVKTIDDRLMFAKLEKAADDTESNKILIQYAKGNIKTMTFNSSTASKIRSRKMIKDNIEVIEVSNTSDRDNVIQEIKKDRSIQFAEADKLLKIENLPNDQDYSFQWGLESIKAVEGWSELPIQKKSIVVAVIDTGINKDHEDLKNRIVDGGYNFILNNNNYNDDEGHGTEVSGVIAAETNNNIGIAGVTGTLDVKILPLKTGDSQGNSKLSDVVAAVNYAIEKKVDVINLSMGSNEFSDIENSVMQEAINNGITVIASAGNNGTGIYTYPASYDNVISAGSISNQNVKSYFSNYNDRISVVAPGEDILSCNSAGNYSNCDGTSFSSPMVAGIAACLKAIKPDLTPLGIKNIIQTTAIDMGQSGRDNYYGYGEANLKNAIDYIIGMNGVSKGITDIVTKSDIDGVLYQYNYNDLRDSFIDYQNGITSLLYSHFIKNTTVAFKADVKGYLDYDNIRNAYINSQNLGQQFNLIDYINSTQAILYGMPKTVVKVYIKDGALLEEEINVIE